MATCAPAARSSVATDADAAAYAASGEVFGACGAAFAIERQLFERLSGFDDDFFMVYEDVDLSYRARLAGHTCWYAADAVVRHAGSATLGTMSSAAVFHGQRNLEWTFIKNTPRGLLWRTLPLHLLYSAAGVFHYIARGQGLAALKGKAAALAGLPRVLAKRRAVQDACRVDRAAIERQLTRGWIAVKRAEKDRSTFVSRSGYALFCRSVLVCVLARPSVSAVHARGRMRWSRRHIARPQPDEPRCSWSRGD